MASIDIEETTSDSITARVVDLDSSYARNDRTLEWYLDNVWQHSRALSAGISQSPAYTFTGLDSNRTYTVAANITIATTGQVVKLRATVTTDPPPRVKPDPWTWDGSNGGDASGAQVRNARDALLNNGEVSDFHHNVWNDLVNKTYEALIYFYSDWSDAYLTINRTRMTDSDTTLTALRFNSLRNNIGGLSSTGMADKERGDPVLGEDFFTLTSALNRRL